MQITPKQTEPSPIPPQVKFYGIGANQVYEFWHMVEPLIEKALEYSDGKYEIWDIFNSIESKEMQLWLVTEDKKIIGCGVTQIVVYPQKNICLIVLLAGEDFDKWAHFLNEVKEWAKDIGCKSIETYGRPGWERKLKNWTKIHTVLRINLDENLH